MVFFHRFRLSKIGNRNKHMEPGSSIYINSPGLGPKMNVHVYRWSFCFYPDRYVQGYISIFPLIEVVMISSSSSSWCPKSSVIDSGF